MRRSSAAVVATAAVASLAIGPAAVAQDGGAEWSQFQGGPGHHGVLTDGPAPPYRQVWRVVAADLDDRALSGAAILDGVAYSVGDRAVYAIDLESGEVEWEIPRAGGPLSVPALVTAGSGDAATLLYLEGPASAGGDEVEGSPAPQEPAGTTDLVAVDLGDRSELWRVALAGVSRTGVTVDDDTAFVGDEARTVHAVSISDGRVRWSTEVAGPVDVPLAAADGLVVVVSRNPDEISVAVDGVDGDMGERRWGVAPQATSTAVSAPAARGGLTVVGLTDRFVTGFDEAGSDVWAHLALSSFSPATAPAMDEGTLYIADLTGGVYRLNAADGSRVWGHQLNELIRRSSPVVSGDAVLVGLNDGRLVALSTASGRLIWQGEASDGLIGAIALSAEVVVAVKGGRDAGLIAFEHDPDGALLDVPSPTEFDPGTTLGRAGVAVAIALVVVLVPGYLARRRFGHAFGDEFEDVGPVEGAG